MYTDCDLLHDQTINPYDSIRMNDDAVRVRNQQTTADFAREVDFSLRHYRPEPVAEYQVPAHEERREPCLPLQGLIAADGF
jgi:hypothetical protein